MVNLPHVYGRQTVCSVVDTPGSLDGWGGGGQEGEGGGGGGRWGKK